MIACHDVRAGGLAVDVANEADALSARGWSVTVVTIARDGNAAFRDRIRGSARVIELSPARPSRLGRRLALGWGLGSIVRDEADLVHVVSCVPAALEAGAFATARRWRRPIVWTPMYHPARRAYWAGAITGPVMRTFDAVAPYASRWADLVLAATDEEAASFRAVGASTVELIPPAIGDEAPRTAAEAASLRNAIGVGDAPMLLVVASRAERRKGLDFAVSSFRRIAGRLPDARLVVAGGVIDRAHGTDPGVTQLGWVSDTDLRSALAAAGVVFVPSRFEAFSRVVIEAWHEGTAVVVTEGVGLRDEVRRTGVPPIRFGDTEAASTVLKSLLENGPWARRVGERGRAVHRRYLLDEVSDHMERSFDALLDPRASTGATKGRSIEVRA